MFHYKEMYIPGTMHGWQMPGKCLAKCLENAWHCWQSPHSKFYELFFPELLVLSNFEDEMSIIRDKFLEPQTHSQRIEYIRIASLYSFPSLT